MDCEGMLVGDQLKQQIANGKAFGMFKVLHRATATPPPPPAPSRASLE